MNQATPPPISPVPHKRKQDMFDIIREEHEMDGKIVRIEVPEHLKIKSNLLNYIKIITDTHIKTIKP